MLHTYRSWLLVCNCGVSLVGLVSSQGAEQAESASLVAKGRVCSSAARLCGRAINCKFALYLYLEQALTCDISKVLGLFWLGWTASEDIHWIVPVLSAGPFGIGFLCLYMALINYVVDSYDVYAASAMGALSASRSIFGVVLPFAAVPMFTTLGVNWGCSLLGFLSALMCLIPFGFIRYGERIREHSKFCQELQRKKAEDAEKKERLWERQRRDMEKLMNQKSDV